MSTVPPAKRPEGLLLIAVLGGVKGVLARELMLSWHIKALFKYFRLFGQNTHSFGQWPLIKDGNKPQVDFHSHDSPSSVSVLFCVVIQGPRLLPEFLYFPIGVLGVLQEKFKEARKGPSKPPRPEWMRDFHILSGLPC